MTRRRTTKGVKGPAALAEELSRWGYLDSPDLASATIRYIVEQWVAGEEATLERVRAVAAQLRRIGAAGDPEAAIVACRLEDLLEEHGHLQLHWADRRRDARAGDRVLSA